jgi:hypothetical protein
MANCWTCSAFTIVWPLLVLLGRSLYANGSSNNMDGAVCMVTKMVMIKNNGMVDDIVFMRACS